MSNITLVEGDITTAKVDAIVNAANPMMLGGGGVDGAIHKAAGPRLLEACLKAQSVNGIRCPTGEARITDSGDLLTKKVIHAVGPRYKIDKNPGQVLANTYTACLDLAISNKLKSIAFPAISCGSYGYPLHEAATIAFSICKKERYADLEIYFYLYGGKTMTIWEEILTP
ncbi:MAG: macro domain-containing protein [Pseudomonadales bacterium]|nr:macro domain-containing protein [Pseudomonadales bacterium]